MVLNVQLELFIGSVCKECALFEPTMSNYGWCHKKKIGSLDRSVYENSKFCEMERRLFNNDILNNRLSGKISHSEMYKLWKK